MNTFFKEIEVVGIENVPKTGPLIICGNHSNQFVDGMLIISKFPREVGLIMAAKSIRRPIIGFVAKQVNVIPVERPQDISFEGKGRIVSFQNNIILGKNTDFLKEMKKGDIIILQTIKKREFVIKEILSATEIALVPSASNPTDVEKIDSAFKVVPHIDQSTLFATVYDHLKMGKVIGIFPEGGSHDRTELIELKAGVSIMALGAMSKYGIRPKILPIGLNYYQANEFRSKVIMDIGDPYEIPIELYELHKKNKKEAVAVLLDAIENRMKSCLITAPSYQHLSAVFMMRRIYKPDRIFLNGAQEFRLNRRFALAIDYFRKHPEIIKSIDKLVAYNEKLKALGIKDEEVSQLNRKPLKDMISIAKSFSLLLFNATFALPGIVVTGPLAAFCSRYGEMERKKALQNSSVKIEGFDVVASYKIICAFVLFPLASLGLTAGFYCWTKHLLLSQTARKLLSLGFFVLWPLYMSIMIRSVDEVVKHKNHLKAKFQCYLSLSKIQEIKQERAALKAKLAQLVEEFGPKVFANFSEGRVISREDIVRDVKSLMETDEVLGFIQSNELAKTDKEISEKK